MPVSEYANSVVNGARSFWQELDIKKWSERIGGSSAEAVEAAIYFCLSFGVGFLFKKYFKYIFLSFILAIVLVKVMEYSHLLIIDWSAVKGLFGVQEGADFNSIVNSCFDWIKEHLLIFIAVTVGFLVGYKLG